MEITTDNTSVVVLWPVAAGTLVICLIVLWRMGRTLSSIAVTFIFGIYLLFALDKVFFPIRLRIVDDPVSLNDMFRWSLNLMPFKFDLSFMPDVVLLQILMNILLTIPFGFGVNFMAQMRTRQMLWLALAVGVSIETMQLAISLVLRYPYRIIDINDVIMNTLGVWVGYGIFRIFAWLYVSVSQRLNIRHSGFANYIYLVALRATATHNL